MQIRLPNIVIFFALLVPWSQGCGGFEFGVVGPYKYSEECDWMGLKKIVEGLQTGWEHQEHCLAALTEWEKEPDTVKEDLSEDTCACLVGLGLPVLNQLDCPVDVTPLTELKKMCAQKYCMGDNIAPMCQCNQDELKNTWRVIGDEAREECNFMMEFWNEGNHLYSLPEAKDCKCFALMPSKGLDLGCKWPLMEVTRPWGKSPSMASIAGQCQSNNLTEIVPTEEAWQGAPVRVLKSSSPDFVAPLKTYEHIPSSSTTTIDTSLFFLLGVLSMSIAGSVILYKCYTPSSEVKPRRNMIRIPSVDLDDDEFGMESDSEELGV